jgi:hypothetical protein
MKTIDRILAWILVLGGLGHGVGSYLGYKHEPLTLLWALSASLFGLLLAAINLLRAGRHADTALAWICLAGNLSLAASAFTFGVIIGNVFDPRALIQGLTTLALAGFSLRSALEASARKA